MARRVAAESGARRRHIIVADKMPERLVLAHAAFEQRGKDLARPHARERAPGGVLMAGGERGAVHRVFDKPLADALGNKLIRHLTVLRARHAAPALPAARQEAACRRIAFAPVERDLHPVPFRLSVRIEGPLVREKRQQHLLDRILIGMSLEI